MDGYSASIDRDMHSVAWQKSAVNASDCVYDHNAAEFLTEDYLCQIWTPTGHMTTLCCGLVDSSYRPSGGCGRSRWVERRRLVAAVTWDNDSISLYWVMLALTLDLCFFESSFSCNTKAMSKKNALYKLIVACVS